MSAEAVKPKVLIVGAGLGGLSLAAIFERAGIPYDIYEKAGVLKPLGSIISLGPGVMPFFKQLGILDQVEAKGKPMKEGLMYGEDLELLSRFDYDMGYSKSFGWPMYIIARPDLHNILLNLIPSERIHLGKRVLSHVESDDGIMIHTSDGTSYFGSILVGADGAYSGVRQSLYGQLAKARKLPSSDKEPLKYSSLALVGQTRPLDEATFAHVEDEKCRVEYVLSYTRPISTMITTTAARTVCWNVFEALDKDSSKVHDNFRVSEWGPEAAEVMCKDIRDFRIRPNMTMGDLIDLTPKEVICKVMLEEKIFQTWNYGRTVLIGDACHKMAPNGGLGAQSAMFDAIVLSNYLNMLETNEPNDIEKALTAYRDERFGHSKEAVGMTAAMKLVTNAGFVGRLVRGVLTNLPTWLQDILGAKTGGYRPQLSFLPLAEDKGTWRPRYQPSLDKTRPGDARAV